MKLRPIRANSTGLGRILAAAWGLGFGVAFPALAHQPLPVGGEFQINTYTTSDQRLPSVAAGANGDFVVIWEGGGSFGTDNFYGSIQGQRFSVAAPFRRCFLR